MEQKNVKQKQDKGDEQNGNCLSRLSGETHAWIMITLKKKKKKKKKAFAVIRKRSRFSSRLGGSS